MKNIEATNMHLSYRSDIDGLRVIAVGISKEEGPFSQTRVT